MPTPVIARQPQRRRTAALKAPTFDITKTTMANGLRVVLAPDRAAPVVGISVFYDVGFRSEPEGRTGFAHLFEHLMFQGSANLEKLEHFRYVQSSGGVFNGSTHVDYTNYYEALPSHALERGLFLEADRMRSPRITEENMANQIAVVKEEIRVNVLNRPYGGFPWLVLPPVLFDTFANSHNGYGGFEDLSSATVADAAAFFDSYYAPANAVLCLAGDFDSDQAMAMVDTHFGGVRSRPRPRRPDFAEAPLAADRRESVTDALAPIPALAIGYRVPDPLNDLPGYLAGVLLAEILSDGDASRLQRSLVQSQRLVTDIGAYLGTFGDPLEERDPTRFTVVAHYPDETSSDAVLQSVQDQFEILATAGPEPGELDRVRVKFVASLFSELDQVLNRSLEFGKFELLFGEAELVQRLPSLLSHVSDDDIRAAAGRLANSHRAIVQLLPGGTR